MMKKNPNYTLCEIADVPYLLPVGQNIADFRRGIRLNASGVFLWNTLDETSDREQLLQQFLSYYKAEPQDVSPLTQDLTTFLTSLTSLGILMEDWQDQPAADIPSIWLQIGGLILRLVGNPEAFSADLLSFQVPLGTNADLTIELKTDNLRASENGTLLIRNEELLVCEHADYYQLFFPNAPQLLECRLLTDGTYAGIWHKPPYGETFQTDLFHAIRFLYLYTAQKNGLYALHSASILYRGKAWLFSGHSGMGKSTHTRLWQTLLDVPVLNGDLNLLAFSDGKPVIYGIPWCGTSGICDTKTYPLGGIILLNQAPEDMCETLSADRKALLVAQRLISPAWTEQMLKNNLSFTGQLTPEILVCLLKCTKEPSAVYTIQEVIDRYMEINNFNFSQNHSI